MLGKQLIQAASGSAAAGGALYVDDVFSTFLYTGNSSSRTITNNIDLSGEGGLVWIRTRAAGSHRFIDTERGATKRLSSNNINAEGTDSTGLTSFTSTGFTLGSGGDYNDSNDYVSWSFRKAPGFFDVVTYTGNGTAGRTISHNLGSTPGFIAVKKASSTGNWICYHRSRGANKWFLLNTGDPEQPNYNTWPWNNTLPTSTNFSIANDGGLVGDDYRLNISGQTYVAYIFAHDEPVFGTDADESIIKCGNVTTSASGTASINLGFEPQWVLFKAADISLGWYIWDTMRGIISGGADAFLLAESTAAESSGDNISLTPTGFDISGGANTNWIYMAIRRPHKPPTAGTDVFNSALTTSQPFSVGFPTDLHIDCQTGSTGSKYWVPRLTNGYMSSTATSAESAGSLYFKFDLQNSFSTGTFWGSAQTINWQFRRAPGFFDVVAYAGNSTAGRTVNHNLGVVPELMIVKVRSGATNQNWFVYNKFDTATDYLMLNDTVGAGPATSVWNDTEPTSSVFTVGLSTFTNANNYNYIAYLFATLAGISKVGTYSGTGNAINVDCGFSTGARFILIKRTDSSGNWYVYDTARGIVSGNDPYLLLNSTAAEVTNTDYIDPLSSGFTVTSSAPTGLNASGGTYLFLAIA